MRIGVRCSSYCTHLHAGLDFSAYAPYARLHFQCNPVCQGFICVTCQERTHTQLRGCLCVGSCRHTHIDFGVLQADELHDRRLKCKNLLRFEGFRARYMQGSETRHPQETCTRFMKEPDVLSPLKTKMPPRFCMIDVDNSGTIEASEFIGPLSRWVHDSKTAPRSGWIVPRAFF